MQKSGSWATSLLVARQAQTRYLLEYIHSNEHAALLWECFLWSLECYRRSSWLIEWWKQRQKLKRHWRQRLTFSRQKWLIESRNRWHLFHLQLPPSSCNEPCCVGLGCLGRPNAVIRYTMETSMDNKSVLEVFSGPSGSKNDAEGHSKATIARDITLIHGWHSKARPQ